MVKTVKGPARRTNSGWLVLPPFELISLMKACSPTTLLSHKSWYAFTVASLRSSTVPLLCSKTFCKHLSKPSLWQRIWGLVNKGALHFVSPVVGMPSARSDKRRAERTEVWISFLGIGVAQSESWTSTCLHPLDLVDADFIATQWKEELCCRSFLLCLRQASLMSLKASSECNDDSKESVAPAVSSSVSEVMPMTARMVSIKGLASGSPAAKTGKRKLKCLTERGRYPKTRCLFLGPQTNQSTYVCFKGQKWKVNSCLKVAQLLSLLPGTPASVCGSAVSIADPSGPGGPPPKSQSTIRLPYTPAGQASDSGQTHMQPSKEVRRE